MHIKERSELSYTSHRQTLHSVQISHIHGLVNCLLIELLVLRIGFDVRVRETDTIFAWKVLDNINQFDQFL